MKLIFDPKHNDFKPVDISKLDEHKLSNTHLNYIYERIVSKYTLGQINDFMCSSDNGMTKMTFHSEQDQAQRINHDIDLEMDCNLFETSEQEKGVNNENFIIHNSFSHELNYFRKMLVKKVESNKQQFILNLSKKFLYVNVKDHQMFHYEEFHDANLTVNNFEELR